MYVDFKTSFSHDIVVTVWLFFGENSFCSFRTIYINTILQFKLLSANWMYQSVGSSLGVPYGICAYLNYVNFI